MRMAASGLTSLFAHQELVLPDGSDELNTALSALKVWQLCLVTERVANSGLCAGGVEPGVRWSVCVDHYRVCHPLLLAVLLRGRLEAPRGPTHAFPQHHETGAHIRS